MGGPVCWRAVPHHSGADYSTGVFGDAVACGNNAMRRGVVE